MKTITYPYAVIMNGEIIPANTPIKVEDTTKEKKVVEEPKEKVVEKTQATEQPKEKAVKKNDTKRSRKS